MSIPSANHDHLLKRIDVQSATALGSSSVYLLMQHPDPEVRFPRPVKIGQRSRWLASEVQAWIVRQKARSEQQRAA